MVVTPVVDVSHITSQHVHHPPSTVVEGLCGVWCVVVPRYLAAMFIAMIGIPIGILARKRLPSEPWGLAYDQDFEEESAKKGSFGEWVWLWMDRGGVKETRVIIPSPPPMCVPFP